jgi:pyridoxal phosphate enzyme (YggS family)
MIQKEVIKNIINEILPSTVKLVAVSKFKSSNDILELYNMGIRDFAESRPQELSEKISILPNDINWHFIGHLQRNKIKMIIDRVDLIHSVDSIRLLDEINKIAISRGLIKNILLQPYIAKEETKQGLEIDELWSILNQKYNYPGVRICGFMGMASFTSNESIIESEFTNLKNLFEKAKTEFFLNDNFFQELSMGMSGDYTIAIKCGSTMVRIGSLIFGDR